MTTYTQIAAFVAEGKTPDEIAVLLREQNVRVDNNQAWTLGLIETTLGEDTAMTLAGVIQQASQTNPLMASAFTAMSTTGIELWSDARQAMIEKIGTAGGMTDDQIAQVKALGVTYEAIDPDATPESVQSLIDAEAKRTIQSTTIASLQDVINPVQNKLNAIHSHLSLESNQALSVADFQALADSLMATADGNPV